ncbi:carbohydrate ABC transporter permease [Nonomuraea muscovyensis]|jgi:raffinose/stachyose/melibiose transport system permease protein|uniref:Raffinose/stachyose/melibiose transport system permease protein n=1 Tax=Nonomuraea muscovyensis TaxID=1124761 RepID=A0A7X0F076_9ACTN|nr:sugar ABC transporter permease [Nonomuraea muscovyensis]MBB6351002.1 raffinose/stachyose/melibiose transport system permease protein [Nonomuraea muscovyensis]MDF2706352.1 transporter permease subunit [Nonomuraea muscovyensis]
MTTLTRGPEAPARPAHRRPDPRRRRIRVTVTLFVLPALVLFLLLVVAPIVVAFYASAFKWNGFGGLPTNFVGLDNFTRLLGSDLFHQDLRNLVLLIAFSLVVQLPFSLAVAMLLNQRIRGRAVYRLVFFAPYVLSEVITGVLFSLILSPGSGLANHLLGFVGLESSWLSDPDTVMYSLFLVMTWKYFGFHMMIYLAGRQGIPNELIEAAQIDGGTSWKVFRHVTLPLLGPTIRISVFLSVIYTIQLFDLVWILTEGGPSHASETMAVTMMEFGFGRNQVGYASAISVVMFVLSFIFALFYQRFVMRRDLEGASTRMGDHR